jgi:hypothetical protein
MLAIHAGRERTRHKMRLATTGFTRVVEIDTRVGVDP